MKIAVIGVGQGLRGDDGAGLEAIRQWKEKYRGTASRADVHVEECELPGLALLDLLDNADATVLVDAVKGNCIPGSIHRLSLDQLAAFTTDTKSAHGWGISETLRLDRLLNKDGKRRVIRFVGIEAKQMNLGESLSPEVRQAIPMACTAIEQEVNELL